MSKSPFVLIALSGGVDSSVAAVKLIEQGYKCAGVFMRLVGPEINTNDNLKGHLKDVQHLTKHLGIKLHIIDLSWDMTQIIRYFTYEYSMGRTPNPCVRCNAVLKFGKLLAFARNIGADYLATGHYAKIVQHAGFPRLARAKNDEKDQSYFLFGINRKDLACIMFPNGEAESKEQIREQAKKLNLPTHDKEDSQEICFVPNDDYVRFLSSSYPQLNSPGQIIDRDGKVLGQHEGIFRYTIGQRRGLKIAAGQPLYVIKINPLTSTIVVGPRQELARTELTTNELNWHINQPKGPVKVQAQIRSTHKPADASMELISSDRVKIKFVKPQYAITPGQAVVFYQDDLVLGGGWIQSDE